MRIFRMNDNRFSKDDFLFMHLALKMGEKGLGCTEPNPMVGAVVTIDGKVISTGYHKKYGDVHAERAALNSVEDPGSTIYISLEPCSHTGHTPPCTDIIIEKKVKRVVIPLTDPNPKVSGSGVAKLKKAGIKVDTGLLEEEAVFFHRHYLKFIQEKLPYVTVNAGVTIDGKLSDNFRTSQWITDESLRNISHSLRGEFSAIMVGSGTVKDDNPMLTIREKGWERKKFVRIILDTKNSLDCNMKIFKMGDEWPLFIFSGDEYKDTGEKCDNHFFVSSGPGGLDLNEVLRILGEQGIASILVEGGGELISSFLKNKLCDEIVLFTADKLLGGRDSVELFADGTTLDEPVILKKKSIVTLESGYILRGLI